MPMQELANFTQMRYFLRSCRLLIVTSGLDMPLSESVIPGFQRQIVLEIKYSGKGRLCRISD